MVLNLDELRERLDAVRAARLQRAVDLNDRVRELEETLDRVIGLGGDAAHPAADDGAGRPAEPEVAYWIEYEL